LDKLIDKAFFSRKRFADIFIVGIPLLVIPFLYSKQLIDPVLIPKFLAFSIYLLFFLFFISRKYARGNTGIFSIIKNGLFLFYLLYFLIAGISLCYTSNFAEGLFEWLKIGLSFIFLLSLTVYYQSSNDLEFNSSKAITLLALIISIAGLIQFFMLADQQAITHNTAYNISLTFAHKNLFAQIMGLTIPFSIYCSFRYRSWLRIICVLTVFSTLCLIIITLSRTVWLALIIGTCSTLVLYIIIESKTIRLILLKKYWKVILLIVIVPFIAVITSTLIYSKYDTIGTFKKQFSSISNIHHGSVKDRIQLWEKSSRLINKSPLFGSGLGSWEIEILQFGTKGMKSEDGVVFYQRPHNDFIWLLCETGILGFGCFALIFVAFFSYVIRILRSSNENHTKLFYYLLFFGLCEYLVFTCFSFPKERIEHAILVSFLIAPIIIKQHQMAHVPVAKTTKDKSGIIFVFLLLAISVGCHRILSEYHVKKALIARGKFDFQNTIAEVNMAESPFYSVDPMSTPISWYSGSAHFRMGNIPAAFADFKRSYDLHPYHVHCINNLATCYKLMGNHEEAIRLYKKAIHLHPTFEGASVNLSIVYLNQQDISLSYQIIRRIENNNKNPKVYAILDRILPTKIDSILKVVDDRELQEIIEGIRSAKDWTIDIHFKSVKNGCSFEHQLFLDAIYILEEQQINGTFVTRHKLREQYLNAYKSEL